MSKFQDDTVDCYGARHEMSLVVLLEKHHTCIVHSSLRRALGAGTRIPTDVLAAYGRDVHRNKKAQRPG